MFKKLALSAALAFAATSSNAATCDVGACGVNGADGQLLSAGVFFQLDDITNDATTGEFNFFASFENDLSADTNAEIAVLNFAPTNFGSIANLFVTVFDGAGAIFSYAITDALGNAINPSTTNSVHVQLDTSGMAGTVFLDIDGVAITGNNAQPDLNIALAPIPLPAGGLLLLTALGAGGIMSRRKNKAA